MISFKKADDLSKFISQQKKDGRKIGFVPTMGALHKGHLALIEKSKLECGLTVASIFVNPTQFNNPEDFKLYPNTIEDDIEALLACSCDVLFLPSKEEIYPARYQVPSYNLGDLETVLEGHYRPGHFQGVCQVVDRLLEIVQPSSLYLGQKDYQQCKVISKLIFLTEREKEIQLVIHPTMREKDGLAMSSRNLRLSSFQRALAPALYTNLSFVKTNLSTTPVEVLKKQALKSLEQEGFKVDYFEVADAETLHASSDTSVPLIAVAAAWLDSIRLIDNLPLN